MRIPAVLAAILALSLAGCGQSGGNGQAASGNVAAGQSFRDGYRAVNLSACAGMFQSAEAQRGGNAQATDFGPMCTCYVDRAMDGQSDAQLRQMRAGPREQEILHQCAREHGMMPAGQTAAP